MLMYLIVRKTTMSNQVTKTVLVTGAAGQLGSEFVYLSKNEASNNDIKQLISGLKFIFVTRKELDIKNSKLVGDFCQQNKIDVIINCAAYTAVDKAESEPEQADAVNHLAVKALAQVAKNQRIILIHISTDYVFDGTNHKPYKESDCTNPQNVYGKTKLDGELAMQAINPANSIIIRTSWVYSEFGNNFVKTMKRLGKERNELNVVSDQIGCPTNAKDLALAILEIIPQLSNDINEKENSKEGANQNVEVYHYSNAGVCSWYDFAQAIFEINSINCKVNPTPSDAYPTPAKRPYYSVMDKSKILKYFRVKNEHWRERLTQ
jgi:dTDP-4-dehydrorhamnose reductase